MQKHGSLQIVRILNRTKLNPRIHFPSTPCSSFDSIFWFFSLLVWFGIRPEHLPRYPSHRLLDRSRPDGPKSHLIRGCPCLRRSLGSISLRMVDGESFGWWNVGHPAVLAAIRRGDGTRCVQSSVELSLVPNTPSEYFQGFVTNEGVENGCHVWSHRSFGGVLLRRDLVHTRWRLGSKLRWFLFQSDKF
jgi:hypothetical protein